MTTFKALSGGQVLPRAIYRERDKSEYTPEERLRKTRAQLVPSGNMGPIGAEINDPKYWDQEQWKAYTAQWERANEKITAGAEQKREEFFKKNNIDPSVVAAANYAQAVERYFSQPRPDAVAPAIEVQPGIPSNPDSRKWTPAPKQASFVPAVKGGPPRELDSPPKKRTDAVAAVPITFATDVTPSIYSDPDFGAINRIPSQPVVPNGALSDSSSEVYSDPGQARFEALQRAKRMNSEAAVNAGS